MNFFAAILILLQWTMGSSTPVAPPPPPPQTSYWTGILDASRAMNWTHAGVEGYLAGGGGIPKYPACQQTFEFPVGSGNMVNAGNVHPTGIQNWNGDQQYNAGDRVADFSGNVEVATVTGRSRPWHPLWPTIPGGTTVDSTVNWVMSEGAAPGLKIWARFFNYKLDNQIVDSNGNTETVTKAGTSAVRFTPRFPTTNTGQGELTCDASGTDVGTPNANDPVACPGLKWQRVRSGTDTALINTALQQCTGTSSAVQLSAGDFYLTYGISFNPSPPVNPTYQASTMYDHVVLRGAGPKSTKLMVWNLGPCSSGTICINGVAGQSGYGGPTGQGVSFGAGALWLGTDGQAGTYHQGSHMLMFAPWIPCEAPANCANVTQKIPKVGSVLHLDQRSDAVGICPDVVPNPPYKCTAVGAHEDGTTVTITTTINHGLSVGQCVGVIMIGPTKTGNTLSVVNTLMYNTLNQNNRVNCDPTSATIPSAQALGFFKVTAVPTPNSFQYTAAVTGLPDSGNGYVVIDGGGIFFNSDMSGAITQSQNAQGVSASGRMCPKDVNGRTPGDHCEPGELGQRTQNEDQIVTRVIDGGTENCPVGDNCYEVQPGISFPNWRSSQLPGAWFIQAVPNHVGIEDLTLDNLNDGSGISIGGNSNGAIKGTNMVDSWFKNLRVLYLPRSAIWLILSSFNTIAETYIYGSKGLQATAYGFEQHSGSSHNLLINNICQRVNGCYMNNFGMGAVEAYNFNISAPYRGYGYTADQAAITRPMIGMNHQTMHWSLFEGNVTPGIAGDDIHGSSNGHTIFRNRLISNDFPRKCLNPFAVQLSGYQRAHNFIGNVIGEPLNTMCAAQWYAGTNLRVSGLFVNGDSQSTTSKCCYWIDPLVLGTGMRWGNYDAYTAAQPNSGDGVRWCADPASPGRTTVCQGIVSATYQGGTISTNTDAGWRTLGLWCTVRFAGGDGNALGVINLPRGFTQNSEIAHGTVIQMEDPGMNYPTPAPTTATMSAGYSTTCQGTINVNAVVGPITDMPGAHGSLAANPVPANHNLPPSFFMSTRPDFFTTTWGTVGWPAIGPDVVSSGDFDASCPRNSTDLTGMASPSGCNGVAHMGYMIPAQICFNHTAFDPFYQITANVIDATWTTGPTVPQPPTNDPANTQGLATITLDHPIVLHTADGLIISGVDPPGYNGQYLTFDQAGTILGEEASNKVRYPIFGTGMSNLPNAPGNPGLHVPGNVGMLTTPNIRNYDARDCYPDSNYAVK